MAEGGKTALITGASKGIGAATARHLAGEGWAVVLAARSGDAIEALAREIVAGGGRAEALVCDVASASAVEAAVARAVDAFGGLDLLINNAAVIEPIGHLAETDPAAWRAGIDINVTGVYHGLRAAIPVMLGGGGGTIVNISSGAATGVLEGWSLYCASKHAVLALTKSVALEYGGRGIVSVGLSPGTVATDMQRQIKASGVNRVSQMDFSDHIPPEWVARAIAALAGPLGAEYAGRDFTLKSDEERARVGLPPVGG
jgi:NAD(P)-dependent dehydrogenase (short-subunit alcohol dehydrogenase family)